MSRKTPLGDGLRSSLDQDPRWSQMELDPKPQRAMQCGPTPATSKTTAEASVRYLVVSVVGNDHLAATV